MYNLEVDIAALQNKLTAENEYELCYSIYSDLIRMKSFDIEDEIKNDIIIINNKGRF